MSSSTNPVGSSSSSSSSTSSQSAVQQALNITPADFLQLITTQMQDQNPLQPSDPTQFLTQLEQMSEVSSMQSMQSSLTSLQSSLQSNQMANGTALIGQTVLAPTTAATLDTSGGTISGALQTPSGATGNMTVTIKDSGGALINTIQVKVPSNGGLANFTWNGTNTLGTAVPAGRYTISASASNGSANLDLTPLIQTKVQSVTVDSSTQGLDLNTENGTVPLSSVVSLY
jgi:flagellar basal-body rod modification protein FlgD